MTCGTGKTLVGLHAAERTAETGRPVIVCVPSIALLHQTVRAWREELGRTMLPISVCSANDTTGTKLNPAELVRDQSLNDKPRGDRAPDGRRHKKRADARYLHDLSLA